MTSYFNLPYFERVTTGNIIMISNIILILLGVIHWGCNFCYNLDCIVAGKYLELY